MVMTFKAIKVIKMIIAVTTVVVVGTKTMIVLIVGVMAVIKMMIAVISVVMVGMKIMIVLIVGVMAVIKMMISMIIMLQMIKDTPHSSFIQASTGHANES